MVLAKSNLDYIFVKTGSTKTKTGANLPGFHSVPLLFHLRYLPAFAISHAQQKIKPFNKAQGEIKSKQGE